jgi:heterodisulfide reductase subunit B
LKRHEESKMAATLAYYPGCSLKSSSKFYEASIQKIFGRYGITLKEIEDWSCCGASAGHTIDERLGHALAARNLALAEKAEYDLFAPCSACYNRSKVTNEMIRSDAVLQAEMNRAIEPLQTSAAIEVKNIIEVLDDYVGVEVLAKDRKYDLSSVKVVPYYGCVLTRMMRVKPYDDKENPESMDRLLFAAGFGVVRWPFKMECCGASKTLTNKDMTRRLSDRIMDMAITLGADAIVTPCPLCQMNLDLLPALGRSKESLPVLFLSEVFELAFYGKMLGAGSHMIPADKMLAKVKEA